jgi:hypothetical protein
VGHKFLPHLSALDGHRLMSPDWRTFHRQEPRVNDCVRLSDRDRTVRWRDKISVRLRFRLHRSRSQLAHGDWHGSSAIAIAHLIPQFVIVWTCSSASINQTRLRRAQARTIPTDRHRTSDPHTACPSFACEPETNRIASAELICPPGMWATRLEWQATYRYSRRYCRPST